ncbi:MAG: DUF4870 domain-containing protein [Dehalococcoidales bacterium]|nr:MAG: DUF4870 domain-containing protein [Dehalococcoidales bacterium]
MGLSPEERKKIYEEEKARIEGERQQRISGDSTTGLAPNVAGLLCYLAGWITGIVFLIIEQKNRFIRFHAVQSIVVFGVITVVSGLLNLIPFIGGFLGVATGIVALILWIVLMIKAYQGELYKIPVAGDIAEKSMPPAETVTEPEAVSAEVKEPAEHAAPPGQGLADTTKITGIQQRMDTYFTNTRVARTTGSSLVIAWSVILLIFFSFFYKYIAYYNPDTFRGVTTWTRYPLLTDDYFLWLPILVTTLVLSIAGHILVMVYDKYWLRQMILIALNILGIVTVVSLLTIFPFNFAAIPGVAIANVVSIVVRITLIAVAIGISVATIVMFVQLVANFVKATSTR